MTYTPPSDKELQEMEKTVSKAGELAESSYDFRGAYACDVASLLQYVRELQAQLGQKAKQFDTMCWDMSVLRQQAAAPRPQGDGWPQRLPLLLRRAENACKMLSLVRGWTRTYKELRKELDRWPAPPTESEAGE